MFRVGWAAAVASGLLVHASAAALRVPVQVDQVLPDGVPGRTWAAEPVSVGVPFAVEEDLDDTSTLGMSGTSAAQFRVLQRDPASGRVTWVLATFVADGGPYAVTTGSGDFGGASLGRDAGDRLVITTGTATFEVRKSGFNVIDRVQLGAAELVAPHADGGIVVLGEGRRWQSSLDPQSDVVLEENGPVAAVVRARGQLRDATGAPGLRYTVRLHFYRGQACVRAFVTLRNADLAALAVRRFDAAWVELPLALGSSREVTFGFPGQGFGGPLAAGGRAHLFQGDNPYQRGGQTDGILADLTPAVGLEVSVDGTLQNLLGTNTDVADGWVRLRDGSHAVLAGMRDFATLFPSGFDVDGDRLAVEMFSRHNSHPDLVFSWGAHETREILLEFGPANADPERFRARVQWPLLGRCEFARYRDTGAHCGERRLVTVEEEVQFFAALGKRWQPERRAVAGLKFDRAYSFGTTGGGNQFDQDECHLLDFLRTGAGGRFLQGRFGALWKADQAVLHSDDFDYSTRRNGVDDIRVDQPAGFHGKGAGNLFDDEHPHWVSMLLYYHLTGDERVREAMLDYGEWRQYRAGNPTYGALWGGGIQHFRLWSRCLRDVALLYELTGQAQYLAHVRRMANVLTSTLETGTSRGRNLDRGYFYFGDQADVTRRIHLFFLTEMNPAGVEEAMRVLPADDPGREELRDYLSGLAYFTLEEAQIQPDAVGYPYGYFAAADNPVLGTRGDQTGIVLTHGYETSGDPRFIERARALAWRVPEYQHPLRASELPTQLRIHRWLHRDEIDAALLEPRAERNADGSYTLHWTAPAGARSYIVKYGPRPLVENLGFDPVRRAFRTDPATAMNFWAAKNLDGEPVPGPAGAAESFRTPVLPAGRWFFKVKVTADRPLAAVPTQLRLGEVRTRPGSPALPAPPPGIPVRIGADPQAATGGRVARAAGTAGRALALDRSPDGGVHWSGLPPDAVVRVYDVAGRLLRELPAGAGGVVAWDRRGRGGARVAAGIALYRVDRGGGTLHRGRFVLVP